MDKKSITHNISKKHSTSFSLGTDAMHTMPKYNSRIHEETRKTKFINGYRIQDLYNEVQQTNFFLCNSTTATTYNNISITVSTCIMSK